MEQNEAPISAIRQTPSLAKDLDITGRVLAGRGLLELVKTNEHLAFGFVRRF